MLSGVTAKNVGDVFLRHSVLRRLIYDAYWSDMLFSLVFLFSSMAFTYQQMKSMCMYVSMCLFI